MTMTDAIVDLSRLSWYKLTAPIAPESRERERSENKKRGGGTHVVRVAPAATCCDVDTSETFLAVGHEDGYTQIWDLRPIPTVLRLLDPFMTSSSSSLPAFESAGPVRSVSWSASGRRLLAIHDAALLVWDVQRPVREGPVRVFRTDAPVNHVATTRDTDDEWICYLSFPSSGASSLAKVDLLSSSTMTVINSTKDIIVGLFVVSSSLLVVYASSALDFRDLSNGGVLRRVASSASSERVATAKVTHCDDTNVPLLVTCGGTHVVVRDLSCAHCDRVDSFQDLVMKTRFAEAYADGTATLVMAIPRRQFCQNGEKGLYYWNRRVAGHMSYVGAPSRTGLRTAKILRGRRAGARLVAVTERERGRGVHNANASSVFLLASPPPPKTWFGPFFSPRFVVLTENETYREAETEFDAETDAETESATETSKTDGSKEKYERSVIEHWRDSIGRPPATYSNVPFVSVELIPEDDAQREGDEDIADSKEAELFSFLSTRADAPQAA